MILDIIFAKNYDFMLGFIYLFFHFLFNTTTLFFNENKSAVATSDTLRFEQEVHLKNLKQLTFGGDNAEAYWSFNSKMLSFQSNAKNWGLECDQIFYTAINSPTNKSKAPSMVSTGKGRTTCAYFMPGDKQILFASTHEANIKCPEVPERRADGKYLWPVYSTFDIYVADLKGKIAKKLAPSPFYDAEATVSPDGKKIVFTSDRTGDLELFVMDIDGKNILQITKDLGYDGGAFFSPDSKRLVFRASRPKTEEAKKEYIDLLKQGLVAPTDMELFTCNIDGSNLKQITNLGKANWAPYFHPDGKRILFSSNHASKRGYQFNIYMINEDGSGLKQITFDKTFDSFPMFSPDGKKISFSSNRFNGGGYDTNIFVADWVD